MIKINKSILMVCLISLFLLVSQASAADSDLNISDISTFDDANIDEVKNSLNQDSQMLNEDYMTDNQGLENDENNDLDNNDQETVDESSKEVKDTTGVVIAGDNYSCGPASLATALNKLGMNLTLAEVSQHTNTTEENGTSMQSLIDAARYYNFTAIGVKIASADLKENSIVHLNLEGGEHWTVVSKVTNDTIFLADSTQGNINMSIEEFNSLYSGNAILISSINSSISNSIITNRNISILDNSQCKMITGKGIKRVHVGYRYEWRWGWVTKYSWVLRPKVVKGHVSFTAWEYVYAPHPVWEKYKVRIPIYKYKYINVHI